MGRREETHERRTALAAAWADLPPALRLPTQFLGRHYAGCGATIGAMPRCDFSCRACYLGPDANSARPLASSDVKAQMRALRAWLGPGGNLQLTDGEITLRQEAELIDLIAYARSIDLVPMLMTHGETFRRRPGLLERLVREGGLSEVCFHVDSTMQGRRDAYAQARNERALMGLRAEFGELVRTVRRRTGQRLDAASTMTVTRDNLAEVPAVLRWFLANADAFKMVSFQPLAKVGRSVPGLVGVTAEELWQRIAEGAGEPALARGTGYLGHPGCSRFVQGMAVRRGGSVSLVPLYRQDDPAEMTLLDGLLTRVGGESLRLDSRLGVALRTARMSLRHAGFLARRLVPYLVRLVRRAGTWRGRYFCVVSHHFMSADELTTPVGQARLASCSFRIALDGRLQPMCAVNAQGLRDALYRGA
ncbi:MAG: hypothetical protein AB7O21_17260 [Gammaproteobacteria bacterium]